MKYPTQKYSLWISGDKITRDDTEQELRKILEDHGFVVQEIEFEGEVK